MECERGRTLHWHDRDVSDDEFPMCQSQCEMLGWADCSHHCILGRLMLIRRETWKNTTDENLSNTLKQLSCNDNVITIISYHLNHSYSQTNENGSIWMDWLSVHSMSLFLLHTENMGVCLPAKCPKRNKFLRYKLRMKKRVNLWNVTAIIILHIII